MTIQGDDTQPRSRAVQENADISELDAKEKERYGLEKPVQSRKIVRAVTNRVGAKGTVGNRVDQRA